MCRHEGQVMYHIHVLFPDRFSSYEFLLQVGFTHYAEALYHLPPKESVVMR